MTQSLSLGVKDSILVNLMVMELQVWYEVNTQTFVSEYRLPIAKFIVSISPKISAKSKVIQSFVDWEFQYQTNLKQYLY